MEVALIALVVVMLIFLLMAVRVVRQGYVYTVERLGKFARKATPADFAQQLVTWAATANGGQHG